MFRLMDEWNPEYEAKRCPKCEKEAMQILGYDPQDTGLTPLHKCTNCGHISEWYEEYGEEVV